jgi:hypothetical protein
LCSYWLLRCLLAVLVFGLGRPLLLFRHWMNVTGCMAGDKVEAEA